MDYNNFEEIIKRKFPTKKTEKGILVETEQGNYEVLFDESADYKGVYSLLGTDGIKDFNVGESDLYPNASLRKGRISGSLLDPNHPFFTGKIPEKSKFFPVRPTKDPKKGWDPSPDHLRKPKDSDDDIFE